MTDQPIQDTETAGRLRNLRDEVRAGAAEAGWPHDADLPAGEQQFRSQLQQRLAEAAALQNVQERPFQSHVPLLGPLIAAFRGWWNRISTTWYVRPILEQQVAFNAAVVRALQDMEHYTHVSSTDVVRRTDALFHIAEQETAVLAARCDDLRGAWHDVTAALERIEAARPAAAGQPPSEPAALASLAAELERLAGVLRRRAEQQDGEI